VADIAIGRPCPRCNTLTAISGGFEDPILHGVCASCGGVVSAAAFGGERFHAVRAAGIPLTAQGLPAPVIPSMVAPAPAAPVHVAPIAQPQPIAAVTPAPIAPAPVATSKHRGGEKNEAA